MAERRQHEMLTAYCGLYCGDCIRHRSRAADLASELRSELERVKFADYARVKCEAMRELRHYAEAMSMLETLIALKCAASCRSGGDGCMGSCQIKGCVRAKALEGCWECDQLHDCHKLDFLTAFHGEAPRKNLAQIKRHGLERWAVQREKCYPSL